MKKLLAGIGIGIKADASIARKIVDGIAIIGIGILAIIGIATIGCGSEIIEQPTTIIVGEIEQPTIEQPTIEQPIVKEPVVITRAEFETIKPGTCDEIAMMGPKSYTKGIEENKILKVVSNDTTEIMWLYCEELWFLN